MTTTDKEAKEFWDMLDKLKKDDVLAIERRMLHKVELQGGEFYLIQDNFVFGRIDK